MTEQTLQTKIIKQLESQGYYVINLIKTNKNGISDLLALKENEPPMFIEVKKPKSFVVSALQRFRIKEQRAMGFKSFATDNINLIEV
tara:strand:- start:99 stop:359 length:261 start_codon:yes stop_codon:yes gene_type:complete